jgi:acyl-CoA synthetase (AMP-forming)/AMP-acid ligase II/aryl carrier-like protein
MKNSISDLTANFPTFVDILRWRALHQPNQQAFIFLPDGEGEEVSITYDELDRQARAIGAELQNLKRTGKTAFLLLPPNLEYVAAFFGCLYAGVVAVPVYPPKNNHTMSRLQAIIADAQATAVVTTAQIWSNMKRWLSEDSYLEDLKWLLTDRVSDGAENNWHEPVLTSNSLAYLQYTSGSTAVPKGVMLTHANLLYNSDLIHRCLEHTQDSRMVSWLPLYHDMGLISGVLQPIYGGFRAVLMPPTAFIQRPSRWLKAISHYQANTSGGPNFAYDLCVRTIPAEQRVGLDLSHWQAAFNGAEPIRFETLERFAAAFASCGFHKEAFYPCYGLAEATLIASGGLKSESPIIQPFQGTALEQNQAVTARRDDEATRLLVGCGQVLPGQQILIVNPESLVKCSPDQVGEIWLSGPSVSQGYWSRPEETAYTFQAHLADTKEGPFLRTGDLGFLKNGELFITGRLKDLIIIRGRNHYPQDIELTVEQSHPALKPGCGAAFSVEVTGEERLVVVQEVDRHYRNLDIAEVAGTIRMSVAEAHELQVYAVVLIKAGSIPKTSSGKIQRHACKSAFLKGNLTEIGSSILNNTDLVPDEAELMPGTLISLEEEELSSLLQAYLRRQAARTLRVALSQLHLHRSLVTMGLDSLMAVELKNRIEVDLGISVRPVIFLQDVNIAQLAAHLLKAYANQAAKGTTMVTV